MSNPLNIDSNSKILVTGGTGFIGSAIANSLKNYYEIIISSRNLGNGVQKSSALNIPFYPIDLSSYSSVKEVINRIKPSIIIHAGASKFIDISESNPSECIEANVIGSLNLAKVAVENNVNLVVGISTDKAASPFNSIYGQSKLAMEQIFSRFSKFSSTNFKCVRFGNVAWSTGSVLPIWWSMYKKNGVIYSTGFNMKRYMMDIDSAVSSVFDAFSHCPNGATLVEDMKWLRISDLLNGFINFYGGSYELTSKRAVDADSEILIASDESAFTKKILVNNKYFYIIDRYSNDSSLDLFSRITINESRQLTDNELTKILLSKP